MDRLRGFAFTADASMALLLGVAVLYTVVASQTALSLEPASRLKVVSESFGATLESTGTLSGLVALDDSSAASTLYTAQLRLIPPQFASNVSVSFYEYSTGACSASCQLAGAAPAGSLCLCKYVSSNTTAGSGNASVAVLSRRVFFVPESGWYGIATTEVSLN